MTTTSSSSGCKKKWWRVADRRDKTLPAKKEKYIINPSAWRQERKSNHRHKEKKRGKHTCSLTDAKRREREKGCVFFFLQTLSLFSFPKCSCRETNLTSAALADRLTTDALPVGGDPKSAHSATLWQNCHVFQNGRPNSCNWLILKPHFLSLFWSQFFFFSCYQS